MAEGDRVGIGGWITTKQGMAWFAEAWTMEEVRSTWPFLTKDAQKYIACFETLAQLALAMTARERHAFSQFSVCLPLQSDNTPSEAGINKLFTTSWPLSQFLQLIASWSSCHGVDLQVSHVAGAHNQWADDLSRGHVVWTPKHNQPIVAQTGPPPPPAVGDTCLLPYRLDLSLKWGSLCLG
ncbi:unnamed protein product [Symbiodinium sp. CCMP2592]|nr:unnamed protein product [Symbiodinium sp. CCMP2592]